MSRTRLRIVLILVVLILVVASILSSLLTYWVGVSSEAPDTPRDEDAGRILWRGGHSPMQSWHSGCASQALYEARFTG